MEICRGALQIYIYIYIDIYIIGIQPTMQAQLESCKSSWVKIWNKSFFVQKQSLGLLLCILSLSLSLSLSPKPAYFAESAANSSESAADYAKSANWRNRQVWEAQWVSAWFRERESVCACAFVCVCVCVCVPPLSVCVRAYVGHSHENWTNRVPLSRWNKNLTKTWNFLNYRYISDVMCLEK